MLDVDEYSRVVALIYEAALQPGQWNAAFAALQLALGCDVFHVFVWDHARQRPVHTWRSPDVPESIERDYGRYYGRIDPRRAFSDHLPAGVVFRCHDHLDDRAVARSEFYQDFLIPGGMRYMLGGALSRSPTHDTKLALLRTHGRPPFSDAEYGDATRLLGHVCRAMALSLREQRSLEALQGGAALADGLETGVVLFGDDGRVLFANAAAERFDARRDGLQLVVPGLRATDSRDARSLAAAWARLRDDGRPQSLVVWSAQGGVAVTLCRLPPAPSGLVAVAPPSRHIAFLTPLARQRLPAPEQLGAMFHLTPAESRLACTLAAGRTLAQCAEASGVKLSTVRSQLLQVLAKTGTARQQDLVALLVRLPVV